MKQEMIEMGGARLAMRYNYAGLYMFEEVAGRAFDARKLWHRHLMYWCMLRANNGEDFTMDFDAFVEQLNASPALARRLDEAFIAIVEERAELSRADSADGGKKKDPDAR